MKNGLQEVIAQIGIDGLQKSMPHIHVGNCDLHGQYAFEKEPSCPLCPTPNGETATHVEHFLDIKNVSDHTSGHNPGQKANPYGL